MAVKKVLFICLGNICRSPLAEGLFLHLVKEQGLEKSYSADSCGTAAYHVGDKPDPRSCLVAEKNGFSLNHKGRQLTRDDIDEFDILIAMDIENFNNTLLLCPDEESRKKLILMRDYDSEINGNASVPDPYYGGDQGFDDVYDMLHRSCLALLNSLENDA